MNKKFLSAILFGALMVTSTGTFVSCKDYDDDIDAINSELVDIKSQLSSLQNQVNSGKYVTNVTKKGEGIVVTWNDGTTSTIETIKGDKGDKGETGATGAAGAKGEATVITIDPVTKNWVVDGVDTGICSQGKDGLNGKDGQDGKDGVDGKDGQDGKDGVDGKDGQDGKDGVDGKDGKDGKDAPIPTFTVGEDSHIYVQYGEDGEKLDLGTSTGGIYYVDNGAYYSLNICDENGEWNELMLPKTAAISEITAVTIGYTTKYANGNTSWAPKIAEGADVTLYYGKAAAKGTYFDGTEFAKGEILTSQQSVSKLSAQINPTMADASLYNFYLTDSKGNSYLTLTQATPNMTEGALTRAASVNKGVYDMGVTFVEGITEAQIKTLRQSYPIVDAQGQATNSSSISFTALAIATTDIYGNEVLSGYDVKVNASTGTSAIATKNMKVEIGKTLDLSTAFSKFENIIDVKYSISKAQTSEVDRLGVELAGNLISAQEVGKIKVTVDWMDAKGMKTTDKNATIKAQTIEVEFVSTINANALTVEWTVAKKDGVANVKTLNVNEYTVNAGTSANSAFKATAKAITYINANGAKVSAPTGAITVGFASADADANGEIDGYYERTLSYTFDPAKIIPTTYTHVIPYGDNDELVVTIVVTEPENYFNFQVLDAYFNEDKTQATAYGVPNGTTVDYDLFKLFTNATVKEAANIRFSEVVPADIKNADGKDAKAAAWLQGTKVADANGVKWTTSDAIKVDKVNKSTDLFFGGAYYARSITAKYIPYGNTNLTAATMTFDLTVKSEIFEGTIEYVKAVKDSKGKQTGWAAGDAKEIDGGKNATLELSEILAYDVYGKAYNDTYNDGGSAITMLNDTRIAKVDVVLANDNAKEYLKLSNAGTDGNVANWDGTAITISKKSANTAIVTPPSCTVQVKVTDKWGKVTTMDIEVMVMK